ncbi:MAG: ABC transporter ATP-binding protein [Ferrimicrobium sp.]
MATAVEARSVSKTFRLFQEKYTSLKERAIHLGRVPHDVFPALEDISFEVEQGRTLGLLGHNGSGKSTLLKCIAGILAPTHGEIFVRGRVAAMLELGAGFHPDLSGRSNIYLNASLFGMSRKEVDRRFDAIVEFSELGPFIENQVKFYSSGMYTRLGFAVAVNMDPDVLLVDEVLAVGDGNFQRKCIAKIREFQKEGRTIIFVSHSPDLVRAICDSAFVLDHGRLVGGGPTAEAVTLLQQLQLAGSSLLYDPATPRPQELTPAHDSVVQLSGLRINGIDAERAVTVASGDAVELNIAIDAATLATTSLDLQVDVIDSGGVAVLRFNSHEMGLDPIVIHGSMEAMVQLASFPLAIGMYAVQVSLVGSLDGSFIEMRQWENAIMIDGGHKGVSGVITTEVSLFVEESSHRRV